MAYIKYIGMALVLLGAALTVLTLVLGKRSGIKETKKELSLIQGAGYAASHREASSQRGPEVTEGSEVSSAVKAPPKKRALNREAREILELVEAEKKQEREQVFEKKTGKGGTGILERRGKSEDATGIMPERRPQGSSSDEEGATGILPSREKAAPSVTEKGGTGVLKRQAPEDAPNKDGGTGILKRPGNAPPRKADEEEHTGVLPAKEKQPAQEKTGVLKRDTLPAESSAGDIDITDDGTGILKRR